MRLSTRNKLKYFGLLRFCPVCKSLVGSFKPMGKTGRPDAICPVCGSFERHRLVWLFFREKTSLFSAPLSMLHVAPENCFIRRFKSLPNIDYHSIDFSSSLADYTMDLTALTFPCEHFHFFYCSHVLEHIPDDGKAIAEIYRILKPGGKAVIMVPVSGDKTLEDSSITCPEERRRIFGQADHVRIYGKDFKLRLENQGFIVHVVDFYATFNLFKKRFFGLRDEVVFYCIKPEGVVNDVL